MLMATLAAVRQGLADAVEAGTGLRGVPYGESDRDPTPPCVLVVRRETDTRYVLGGGVSRYMFALQVCVRANATDQAVAELDDYADVGSGRSVKTAVEDENNWTDDLVNKVEVLSTGPVLEVVAADAGTRYLMVEFETEVEF